MSAMLPEVSAELAKLKANAEAQIAKMRADAEAEIAALKSAAGAPVPEDGAPPAPAGPTHDLLLSDGRTVEHTGAIPTLVHIGEDILSVVAAFEKRSQP